MNENDEPFDAPRAERPNKSEIKRREHARRELVDRLLKMPEGDLRRLELPEDLQAAVDRARAIRKGGGLRRERLLISKLLRQQGSAFIEKAFGAMDEHHHADVARQHRAEQWRERLLDPEDGDAVTEFFDAFPEADRQTLRNLVRQAVQDREKGRPPRRYRELFRFIRRHVEAEE